MRTRILTTALLLAVVGIRQSQQGATASAAQVAATRPTTSRESPKEACRSFAAAVEREDRVSALEHWHVDRPPAKPLAEVLTRQFMALAELRRATTEKVGADVGRRLPLNDLPSDAIKGATEDIGQDSATLRWIDAGGTERDIDLVRVNGVWKLSPAGWLSSDIERVTDEEIADTAAREAEFNTHIQRTIERVRAGKLRTVHEIVRSLRE